MVRVTVLRVMLCILVVSSAITSCAAGSGGRKQVGKVKCGGDRKQVGKIKCGGGRKQVGKVKCGGKLCSIPNASPTCVRGKCVLKTCDQGYANCDGLSGNGCEVNLNTDALNCGGCNTECSIPNADATCAAGSCVIQSCNSGYANCDGLPGNRCEVNLNTDALNCGGCNIECSIPNAVATCAAGTCVIQSCNSGYANCDGLPGNGCEVNLNTDALNCGGCNIECSIPNAVATCAAGTCVIQSCNPGYHVCGDECVADNVIGEGGACCDTQHCVGGKNLVCEGEGDKMCTCPSGTSWCPNYEGQTLGCVKLVLTSANDNCCPAWHGREVCEDLFYKDFGGFGNNPVCMYLRNGISKCLNI